MMWNGSDHRTRLALALGLVLPLIGPALGQSGPLAERPGLRPEILLARVLNGDAEAMTQLARWQDQGLEPLLEVARRDLLDDPPNPKASQALRALPAFGSLPVEPMLGWLGDESPALRRFSARALGRLQNQRAVPALLERLEQETEAPVRREVVQALGHLGPPEALPLLFDRLAQLDEESPPSWRLCLRSALYHFAFQPFSEELATALQHPHPEVRRMSCEIAARSGDLRALPALIPLLADPEAEVVAQARQGLSDHGPEAVPALRLALHHEAPRARAWGARMLGELHARRALFDLSRALEDPQPEVRKAVEDAILEIWQAFDLDLRLPRTARPLAARRGLEILAEAVKRYREQEDRTPVKLSALQEAGLVPQHYLIDPWSRPYQLLIQEGEPVLRSLGADGLPGGPREAADVVRRLH